MANIITIELCAEDRARLDRLTAALEAVRTPIIIEETIAEPTEYNTLENSTEMPQKADEADKVETTPPETETPKTEEKPAAPAVTVEDIRSKVLTLTGAGKKDEVRTIIKAYAEKVGDIPEDKRAEVLEKLTALEG